MKGYARTVVTLALCRGKRVDVTVSGSLVTPAELLRLNSLCSVVSAGFGVRKSESVIGFGLNEDCLGGTCGLESWSELDSPRKCWSCCSYSNSFSAMMRDVRHDSSQRKVS